MRSCLMEFGPTRRSDGAVNCARRQLDQTPGRRTGGGAGEVRTNAARLAVYVALMTRKKSNIEILMTAEGPFGQGVASSSPPRKAIQAK